MYYADSAGDLVAQMGACLVAQMGACSAESAVS